MLQNRSFTARNRTRTADGIPVSRTARDMDSLFMFHIRGTKSYPNVLAAFI